MLKNLKIVYRLKHWNKHVFGLCHERIKEFEIKLGNIQQGSFDASAQNKCLQISRKTQ